MRIFITGSNGQLGTELSRLLAGTDHDVQGVDIDTCDISDRMQIHDAISTFRPELILHGAAFTAVDRCESEPEAAFRANALATRFIAEAARKVSSHVVYVSTDYVFDGAKPTPYVEWDLPSPRSVYGLSKLGGEMEIDPAWTIARTSWVCSAHGNNMVKTVLRLAAGDATMTFVDDQIGHPTFASDLAAKLVELGLERAPGRYHVTNQGSVSWYEFVQAILVAAGESPDRVQPQSSAAYLASRPSDAPPVAPRPANSVLDNLALRGSGFSALRDFREPLSEVVVQLQAG